MREQGSRAYAAEHVQAQHVQQSVCSRHSMCSPGRLLFVVFLLLLCLPAVPVCLPHRASDPPLLPVAAASAAGCAWRSAPTWRRVGSTWSAST